MWRMSGDRIDRLSLPSISGGRFEIGNVQGKRVMISFFRFASCPFCNLRIHELSKRFAELGDNFTIIAIFDSPLENLQRHAERHQSPFPILADENNVYYRAFGIERSVFGVLKGMITRMPTLLYAMFGKGYLPLRIRGDMTIMPADFLIDENSIIRLAHYGRDEGDSLPFERIKEFALEGRV